MLTFIAEMNNDHNDDDVDSNDTECGSFMRPS